MIRRLTPIFIFFILCLQIQAQTWRRVGNWGNHFHAIVWLSEETGYMAGEQIILKTIDGGLTWQEQEAPTKNHMLAMDFIDENRGLIVGKNGQVFRTENAGSTWQLLQLPTDKTLKSVKYLNANRVYIVGEDGEVYRSTNGGQSFARQSIGTSTNLNSLYFVSQDTGYIAAQNGQVFRTVNQGNNWASLNTGQSQSLEAIYFSNGNTGYAVGNQGTILKTVNAGQSWTQISSGTNRTLRALDFNKSNPDIGLILGDNGIILRTVDAGATFSGVNINNTETYYSVSFRATTNMVFTVGSNGFTLSSTNSGSSWSVRLSGRNIDYEALQFRTATLGYLAGDIGSFLVTTNGGNTFTDRSRPLEITFNDLQFTTNAFGYLAGENGTLLKTTNTGTNWTSLNPGTEASLRGLFFFNNNDGYVVGENKFMARTSDAGVSWENISLPGSNADLEDLLFFDETHGIVIGKFGYLAVTSNGESWEIKDLSSSVDLNALSTMDEQTAIVVGNEGRIWKTANRGQTWTSLQSGQTMDLTAVHFLDESIGFVAGKKGLILQTTDGGQNWSKMPTGTFQDFTAMSFGDLSSGFVVGEKGTLFNYSCQVPETPTIIFGESNICISNQTYRVQNSDQSVESFDWRVDGGTILEGQGTDRIEVRWDIPGRNAVLVRGQNNCGNGGTKGMEVLVSTNPEQVSDIQGEGAVCLESFMPYGVTEVPGTVFIWEVTGGLITEGQGTHKVIIQWKEKGSRSIKVTPNNPCGVGPDFSRSINVSTPPEQPSPIIGPEIVGLTEETYSVDNVQDINYQWTITSGSGRILSGQGTNSIRVIWEKEGDFTVRVTPMNDCDNGPIQTLNVKVSFITSLPKEIKNQKLLVYPNPSTGEAILSFEGISDVRQVQITDSSGKIFQTFNPALGTKSILLQNIPKGFYIINVRTRKGELREKLIVK